ALLRYLDAVFEANRDQLATSRRPSEIWQSNCLAGISFMHKAEVEMRDEIGVDTMCFGRDYPHGEGTWPNTRPYLHGLFQGVPEADVRKILGENMIRFLDLDAGALAKIAARVGPTVEEITGDGPDMDPGLEAHLDER